MDLHEAKFYVVKDNDNVRCKLCPNLCYIKPNDRGICNVRINIKGKLYTMNYGLVTSGSKDPIEKKPLYHFLPGSCAYSYGTVGCNIFCQFCQNHHIARGDPEKISYGFKKMSPKEAAKEAKRSGCETVAYTYNEPSVWYEWVYDTAKEVKKLGLKNVLITNGYIEEEPLRELLPYIDGANVDLKGDKEFYKELCLVSHQEAVLRTCKVMAEHKILLEITNLLIPGKNDSKKQLQELIDFIINELGPEIPLHFSRYHPAYKLKIPATPTETLYKAYKQAKDAGLLYVYLGNIRTTEGTDTICKTCGAILVQRSGYFTKKINLSSENTCKKCLSKADFA